MRTWVKMCQPRFAPLIRIGVKRHTIRPWPKVLPKVGDLLDLRVWEGKPYRSKQQPILTPVPIVYVTKILIGKAGWCKEDSVLLSDVGTDRLAYGDGFRSWREMHHWFLASHAKAQWPFHGVLIEWDPEL